MPDLVDVRGWGELEYWLVPSPPAPEGVFLLFLPFFALGLTAAAFLYFGPAQGGLASHPFRGRVARTIGFRGMVYFFLGVLLVSSRYVSVPLLSMRALLAAHLLAGVGLLGYLGYFLFRRYPGELAEYDRRLQRQRPTARSRPPRRRGGRRRR